MLLSAAVLLVWLEVSAGLVMTGTQEAIPREPARRAKALEAVGPIGTEQSSWAAKLVKLARSAGEPRGGGADDEEGGVVIEDSASSDFVGESSGCEGDGGAHESGGRIRLNSPQLGLATSPRSFSSPFFRRK